MPWVTYSRAGWESESPRFYKSMNDYLTSAYVDDKCARDGRYVYPFVEERAFYLQGGVISHLEELFEMSE